jgi:hypothetical protein
MITEELIASFSQNKMDWYSQDLDKPFQKILFSKGVPI